MESQCLPEGNGEPLKVFKQKSRVIRFTLITLLSLRKICLDYEGKESEWKGGKAGGQRTNRGCHKRKDDGGPNREVAARVPEDSMVWRVI